MKQIVDKLNKIAKAIDENVELSDRDLIIDSLDSITKAFGGTPNNSNLIVDKLEDIAGVVHGGGSAAKKVVIISEQTVQGEQHEGETMYTADVNLENKLTSFPDTLNVVLDGTEYTANVVDKSSEQVMYAVGTAQDMIVRLMFSANKNFATVTFPDGDQHTIEVYSIEQPSDPNKYVIIAERTVQGEEIPDHDTYPTETFLTNQMIDYPQELNVKLDGVEHVANLFHEQSSTHGYMVGESQENFLVVLVFNELMPYMCNITFPDGDSHTIEVYTDPKEASSAGVRTCTITIDNKSDQDITVGPIFSQSMPEPMILNDGIVDSTVLSEVVPVGSQKEIKLIYSTGTNEANAVVCYLASSLAVNMFKNQINCEIVNSMLIATEKTRDSSATLVFNVK